MSAMGEYYNTNETMAMNSVIGEPEGESENEEANRGYAALHPWILGYQLFVFLATTASLVPSARIVYRRTEIGHPLYAVLLQDLVALLISAVISGMAVLASIIAKASSPHNDDLAQKIISVPMECIPATIQFHQVSWLTITCLRFVFSEQKCTRANS